MGQEGDAAVSRRSKQQATTRFKKNSLWQAEDLDAVFDQDPQRVCVLQGPVAARHATKVNESIKDILGGVEQRLIQLLLELLYDGDASKVPTVQYLSREAPPVDTARACETLSIKYTQTQDDDRLIRRFALGSQTSVVQTRSNINNPVKRVFAPRPGQTADVVFAAATMKPLSVRRQGASSSYDAHDANFVAVELRMEPGSKAISVTMSEERRGESIPLALEFVYRPD
ncbi:fatty acid synthase alpha subunit Lsd1 [Tilletia horrida]|nr:fatty acid synthase alpha subunit Lsd1 [Tilletia horrida]